MAAFASTSTTSKIDTTVWLAIAGKSFEIPSLNSYVYYFPQGHLEHSPSTSQENHGVKNVVGPFFLCEVLGVDLGYCPLSDEALIKILLQPHHTTHEVQRRPTTNNKEKNYENDVVSFTKILTPSDANKAGSLSVPKSCAESIFPEFDCTGKANPQLQSLSMRDDSQNRAWEFRHVYRGRHLLTTGWSEFVIAKKLVKGDSVVFGRRKSTDEIFVGIRRARKSITAGAVAGAIGSAARGTTFEVVYCPRVGLPDFVVSVEKVENALQRRWNKKMHLRMMVETENSTQVMWHQGKVANVIVEDSGPWAGSPWRMLQVKWDETSMATLNIERVSPWQVEYVPDPPPQFFFSPLPPSNKKLKASQDRQQTVTNVELESGSSSGESSRSTLQHTNPAPLNCSSPVRGARREQICIPKWLSNDNPSRTPTEPELRPEMKKTLSTDMSSNSENVSAPNRSGFLSSGANSLRLFGKVVRCFEPGEGGSKNKGKERD